MSEELIIRHCSPTLAWLKTANMFSCRYEDKRVLNGAIRAFNKRLGKKGLRMMPIRHGAERALICVFRPAKLKAIFTIRPRAHWNSCPKTGNGAHFSRIGSHSSLKPLAFALRRKIRPLKTRRRRVFLTRLRAPLNSCPKRMAPFGCHPFWSGKRGSNPPPPPWQGGALPNELFPRIRFWRKWSG